MGNINCSGCGQWTGKNHHCPVTTAQTSVTPIVVVSASGNSRNDIGERVARARAYLEAGRQTDDPTPLFAYHGTSTAVVDSLGPDGTLRKPYITADEDIAWYYAEEQAEIDGGEPTVLAVEITHPDLLRYDAAAMDEPVMVDEEVRDFAWEEAERLHPDWASNGGYLNIPEEEWRVSWEGSYSAYVDGPVREWAVIG